MWRRRRREWVKCNHNNNYGKTDISAPAPRFPGLFESYVQKWDGMG